MLLNSKTQSAPSLTAQGSREVSTRAFVSVHAPVYPKRQEDCTIRVTEASESLFCRRHRTAVSKSVTPKLAERPLPIQMEPCRVLPTSFVLRGIINFTPSWYSVIMGTGILSILLHDSPHRFRGESMIGTLLYFANVFMFFAFTVISTLRMILYPWVFRRLLEHPQQSLFLGTVPMGLATIVNATVLIAVPKYDWAVNLSWFLWWADVFLTVLCIVVVPLVMFQLHDLSLDSMTGAWLLPIVPAVVCSASGGWVASVLPQERAIITLTVSWVLWGIGISLSFLVFACYFHRLVLFNLPNPEVIISAFLPLGPCGQGSFAIIKLGEVASTITSDVGICGLPDSGKIVLVTSVIVGLMLWGLGLWWLIHGTACVAIRMLSSRLRFNMGFWSFIFPLGVFISGTIALGETMKSKFFDYLSVVLLACLAILYCFITFYTVSRAFFGNLLVDPCLADLK